MVQKKSETGSLAKQIDSAKKNIESWPAWLRKSARFEGRNHSFDQRATDANRQDSTGGAKRDKAEHD